MRIIKKYEEFLKEAIYAPPPPPPPAIYSTVDMKKADDSGNYQFQTGDWNKGDKASENKKIDPSEWGIPDANLPETVEGWKSSNDPFIKAYSNYLNDSTGTQKGYVGKTLLIFQKKDGKELKGVVQDGKYLPVQNEMTYYYVTKDAVKYKVESSFKDAKGGITIFAGKKATRSFDLASGQMLVKKSAHDKLVNGDLINTPVDREGKLAGRDDVTLRISYLPAAEPNSQTFNGKVDIFLNTNGKQLSVTDSSDIIFNSSVDSPFSGNSNSPILLSSPSSYDRNGGQKFTIDNMGKLTAWGNLKEVSAKYQRTFDKNGIPLPYEIPTLGVPGVRENHIVPNIEGYGTVYAYNYIYRGTVNGNIIYRVTYPSEVEDSFGNTAKGYVENGFYSVPLNTARWGHGSYGDYLAPSDDDVNVHQPFKTDAGKKALSSIVGKNGKQIEVKWDAKAKKFVSDLKVIKATKAPLTDSQRRQMIN